MTWRISVGQFGFPYNPLSDGKRKTLSGSVFVSLAGFSRTALLISLQDICMKGTSNDQCSVTVEPSVQLRSWLSVLRGSSKLQSEYGDDELW